jgi:hypothetical protein
MGCSFLRRFWTRWQMDDNDVNAIFRSRQVEKMKLRKKIRNENDSYVKLK